MAFGCDLLYAAELTIKDSILSRSSPSPFLFAGVHGAVGFVLIIICDLLAQYVIPGASFGHLEDFGNTVQMIRNSPTAFSL